MNKLAVCALLLLTGLAARAADTLMPYNTNGKWGFVVRDAKQVEFALAPTYELAYPFREGRAAVRQKGLWGFIDDKGAVIIPCRYAALSTYEFQGGVVVFVKGGLYGAIDRDGKEILPPKFTEISVDAEAAVIVASMPNPANPNDIGGLAGLYDNTGKQLLPHEYTAIYPWFKNGITSAAQGGRMALIDNHGKALTGFDFRQILHSDIDHFIGLYEEGHGQAHFDGQGRLLFKSSYPYVGRLSDNRAVYKAADKRYGYLTEKGEVAIPAQFFLAENFKEGIAFASREVGGAVEAIDVSGKSLATIVGGDLTYGFSGGTAWVRNRADKKYYCYDRQLNRLFAQGFESARSFDTAGLAVVTVARDKVGLIDKKGQFVLQPEYSRITPAKAAGQYIFTKDRSSGIANSAGQIIFAPQPVRITDYDDQFYRIGPTVAAGGEYHCFWRRDGVFYYDNRPAE